MPRKVECLVVDTTAFIKNKSLQDIATNIFTVQEVVDEIRNKRQLRNLVVLPYELQVKDVFSENVVYITEFSKKTGDYPSLSLTDIKVMALTYQLEKEKVGTEHLAKEPQVNRVVDFSKNHSEILTSGELTGFYTPSQKNSIAVQNLESGKEETTLSEEFDKELSNKFQSLDCDGIDKDYIRERGNKDIIAHVKDYSGLSTTTENEDHTTTTLDTEFDTNGLVDGDSYDNSTNEEGSDDDDDDDIGWITLENIAQVKKEINGDNTLEEEIVVACITADFAMQNVLKQVGLHIVSIDGLQINHLETFILRCYACFKTTSIMTKLFCPNCGNKTLKKVAVSLNEDGTQHIHINAKRPITARGKKFSLPTPKGGKHASYPYVCEDQKFPHQRPTRLAREKNNPLDPDYIAGFSPFVMRDINSRSAILGIHGSGAKYWMKKNPNEGKRNSKN